MRRAIGVFVIVALAVPIATRLSEVSLGVIAPFLAPFVAGLDWGRREGAVPSDLAMRAAALMLAAMAAVIAVLTGVALAVSFAGFPSRAAESMLEVGLGLYGWLWITVIGPPTTVMLPMLLFWAFVLAVLWALVLIALLIGLRVGRRQHGGAAR